MNLQQLRDYVRSQLDVDEEEYPNSLLDAYFSEGFYRTVSLETDWPSYQHQWTVQKADGVSTITIPADAEPSGIYSLFDTTTQARLTQTSPEQAEDYLFNNWFASDGPLFYTIWGDTISLWPTTTSGVRDYSIRGQRKPAAFPTNSSSSPDCDERLHILIAHYAIALMYANQEDEVMEEVYMKRWQQGYAAARHAILATRHHRPLVLNGGLLFPTRSMTTVNWNLP